MGWDYNLSIKTPPINLDTHRISDIQNWDQTDLFKKKTKLKVFHCGSESRPVPQVPLRSGRAGQRRAAGKLSKNPVVGGPTGPPDTVGPLGDPKPRTLVTVQCSLFPFFGWVMSLHPLGASQHCWTIPPLLDGVYYWMVVFQIPEVC